MRGTVSSASRAVQSARSNWARLFISGSSTSAMTASLADWTE